MFSASLTYVVIVVPFSVLLGLGAALLISSLRFGGEIYKTVFFLPVMATLLAMAIVWEFTLDPVVGLVNKFLHDGCDVNWFYQLFTGSWLGFEPANSWYGNACAERMPNWLGNKNYAIWTISFIKPTCAETLSLYSLTVSNSSWGKNIDGFASCANS